MKRRRLLHAAFALPS